MNEKIKKIRKFTDLPKFNNDNLEPTSYFGPYDLENTAGNYRWKIQLHNEIKGEKKRRKQTLYTLVVQVLEDYRDNPEKPFPTGNKKYLFDLSPENCGKLQKMIDDGYDVFSKPVIFVDTIQRRSGKRPNHTFAFKPVVEKELKPNPPTPIIKEQEKETMKPQAQKQPMKSGLVEIDNGQFNYPKSEAKETTKKEELNFDDKEAIKKLAKTSLKFQEHMKAKEQTILDYQCIPGNSKITNYKNVMKRLLYFTNWNEEYSDDKTPYNLYNKLGEKCQGNALAIFRNLVLEYNNTTKTPIGKAEMEVSAKQILELWNYSQTLKEEK